MVKPRKRKATTTRKKSQAKPAKRSTSRRRAVSSDDDVFIPKARREAAAPLADADEAVFIPRAGRPVEVQSDLVDDIARGRHGVSNSEFWESMTPRAGTPGGWTPELLSEHGLQVDWRGHVVCRYGGRCDGTTSNIAGVSSHHYSCAYWTREGKDKTPF